MCRVFFFSSFVFCLFRFVAVSLYTPSPRFFNVNHYHNTILLSFTLLLLMYCKCQNKNNQTENQFPITEMNLVTYVAHIGYSLPLSFFHLLPLPLYLLTPRNRTSQLICVITLLHFCKLPKQNKYPYRQTIV